MKFIYYDRINVVLFPEYINHRDIHESVYPFIKKEPKYAGFVTIQARTVKCFGKSISLGLQAGTGKIEEDVLRIIEKTFEPDNC